MHNKTKFNNKYPDNEHSMHLGLKPFRYLYLTSGEDAVARPGLKRGPAAHPLLRNRNATSHATSKRRPPPGLVYCEVKLTTVGLPT